MGQTRLAALGEPIPVPRDGGPEVRKAVADKARSVIRLARAAFPGWSPPPFGPETFAAALGIPVIQSNRPVPWDAALVPFADGPRIICNGLVRSAARRRFSVAHEIAHCFFADADERARMRTANRDAYDESPESRRLERMCDLGAAELLMPQPWFGEAVSEAGFTAESVTALAGRFGVSLEAAGLRMMEHSPRPCAVGFFHYAAEPTAGQAGKGRPGAGGTVTYRVKRAFRSPGFPFLFPTGKSIPSGSVIYRASLRQGGLESRETFSLGEASHEVHVSAFPLHDGPVVTEPPTVVAVLSLVTQ